MAPAKTGKSPARTVTTKTPLAKKKTAPNASILSFFQRVPPPEESIFVGDGLNIPVDRFEDNIYDENDEPMETTPKSSKSSRDELGRLDGDRYNESQSSVKRRKLSVNVEPLEEEPSDRNGNPEEAGGAQGQQTPEPSCILAKRPKPKRKGPFLESDSEDEPENATSQQLPPFKPISPPTTATFNPQGDGLGPRAESHASRVTAPMLKKEETSVDMDDFEKWDDANDNEEELDEGEEYRERKFMAEQARLEAEEAGITTFEEGADTMLPDESIAACCPICNSSLAGVTPDDATVHVNACLDGNPTPLPLPLKRQNTTPPPKLETVEAPEVSKRFARAANPRPGQSNPISLGEVGAGPSKASGSAFTKLMSGHAEDAAWATAAAAEHASRGKPAYERTCPFYKIMPGFFICVDAFRYGAVEGCKAYFLSHFHSDHYIGLTANWSHGPIYCSKVTGSLVKSQLRTAAKWVVELEFEETVEVPGTQGVTVTMIPANHCPGSSLFLFEKTFGNKDPTANGGRGPRTQRILHCGDFRACPAHMEHPLLKPETIDSLTGKTKQQKIDICYLDTTYLNPKYSFPPQDDVITACAELCASLNTSLGKQDESEWNAVLRRREGTHALGNETVSKFFAPVDVKSEDSSTALAKAAGPQDAFTSMTERAKQNRNRLLVVCGTYSIGKERICKAIAIALKTKIFAAPAKIKIVSQLGDPELTALMTSDPLQAQVHMQMLMELRAETLAEYLDSYRPHFGRIVGFRPSGWNYRPTMANAGKGAAAAAVGANLPPGSVPSTAVLHGPGWRTRFGTADLVPQRGSSREAMCFGAPYSEHSSFRELALFVMGLRIERVVPTVNVGSEPSRRRMKAWLDRWMSERRRGGVVRVLSPEEMGVRDGESGAGKIVKREERVKGSGGLDEALWDGKDGRGGGVRW